MTHYLYGVHECHAQLIRQWCATDNSDRYLSLHSLDLMSMTNSGYMEHDICDDRRKNASQEAMTASNIQQ